MHEVEVKSILSAQNGMNLFRGCVHGCIYCDSRSRYYQINHLFEDVELKRNAPELLEQALRKKRKKCMIGTGSMSDPYLPFPEPRRLRRQCLKLIADYGFGLAIQTKSAAVLEDLDLFTQISRKSKCVVQMTLTTYDEALCSIVEPDVSTTKERVRALLALREAGIPTVVWLSPILPFLNDTEENLKGILGYCIRAGVKGIICFGMGMTLREGSREYYYGKLRQHFPGLAERYEQSYGNSYELVSPQNERLMKLFRETCRSNGILSEVGECFDYLRHYEEKETYEQISLW